MINPLYLLSVMRLDDGNVPTAVFTKTFIKAGGDEHLGKPIDSEQPGSRLTLNFNVDLSSVD